MMFAAIVASAVACTSASMPLATEQRAKPKSKPEPDAGPFGPDAGGLDIEEGPPVAGPRVKIRKPAYEGDLCPEESVLSSIADHQYTATIIFSMAEVQPADREKLPSGSCHIALELQVPDGMQFRNATIFPQGYIFARDGKSNMVLGYSYPATGERQVIEHPDLSGDEPFLFTDRFDAAWSPTCGTHAGKPLALELDFDLSATGDAYLNVSSIDLNFDIDSTLEWRRCDDAD